MSEQNDVNDADIKFIGGLLYMIGLVIVSLAIGTMADHQAVGWLTLGAGCIAIAVLIYLGSGSSKEFQDVDNNRGKPGGN